MTFYDGFRDISGTYRWTGDFYYPSELVSDSVILYKLHGSLNWKKTRDGKILRGLGEARPHDVTRFTDNILFYPSLDIKNYKIPPYDSIKHEFEKSFDNCQICIMIGCSFRDKQINDVLKSQSKKIVVISPTIEEDINSNFLEDGQKMSEQRNIIPIPGSLNEESVGELIKQLTSYI